MTRELSTAALKASPPLTVYALTLNEWVAVATIAYLVLQGLHLLWVWRGEVRAKKAAAAVRLAAAP